MCASGMIREYRGERSRGRHEDVAPWKGSWWWQGRPDRPGQLRLQVAAVPGKVALVARKLIPSWTCSGQPAPGPSSCVGHPRPHGRCHPCGSLDREVTHRGIFFCPLSCARLLYLLSLSILVYPVASLLAPGCSLRSRPWLAVVPAGCGSCDGLIPSPRSSRRPRPPSRSSPGVGGRGHRGRGLVGLGVPSLPFEEAAWSERQGLACMPPVGTCKKIRCLDTAHKG